MRRNYEYTNNCSYIEEYCHRFDSLQRPKQRKATASPLRNEKSHFEWRRSPHVVFGPCPGLDGLRSMRQLSSRSRRKRAFIWGPRGAVESRDLSLTIRASPPL